MSLARGDFGNSLTTGQPVATEIRNRLPASAELTLLGLFVSIVIAIPLGVMAATRPGSWIDHLCRVTTTAGVSLPVFFTGLVLVYIFYFRLGWSPAPLGRLDVFYSAPPTITGFYLIDSLMAGQFKTFGLVLSHLALPAMTLAAGMVGIIARIARSALIDVGQEDFISTAVAKGLSRGQIVRRHLLPNAAIPIVTLIGFMVGALIAGAVVSVASSTSATRGPGKKPTAITSSIT